jgi:aerobic carbon-monoxide dehydrogenase medium subunit
VTAGAEPDWMAPGSLEEAVALRAEHGDEATVLAGGTFLGILMNQGLLSPSALLSLGRVPELTGIDARGDELRLGAMTTHTAVERSAVVRERWPVLARAFRVVASPRVRNQATVGGVLADADYASDPPAVFAALGARAVLRSPRGERSVGIDELIRGYYETCIEPDELLVEVVVPAPPERATYRKFRSRSTEDRPCVAVAAVRDADNLRVVVGAVAEVPQHLPDVCALAGGRPLEPDLRAEIARRYGEGIEAMSDSRGSAAYRRRIIAVEVRRALEEIA